VLHSQRTGAERVITGKVMSDAGTVIEDANVVIIELACPCAPTHWPVLDHRAGGPRDGQPWRCGWRHRVHAGVIGIRVTRGRAPTTSSSEGHQPPERVVVTGRSRGRSGRRCVRHRPVTAQELPVPALDPIRALSGKVGGCASRSRRPAGLGNADLMRGRRRSTRRTQPGSAHHRDGAIQRSAASMRSRPRHRVGGSGEGRAGASLYGATAATA